MDEVPNTRRTDAETYTHGYSSQMHEEMARRTALSEAAFFLPHLRSGMSLVDCGCGPGTITIGLADAVAPGQVVGIDLGPVPIEQAYQRAAELGISNVRFEVANVYELPFPDASFDAAFAHTLLVHLREPLRALKEMRRVLKPGGIIGVRDTDWSTFLLEPSTLLLDRARALFLRVLEQNGASLYYARHQRRLFREAGFARSEGYALGGGAGNLDQTRFMANLFRQQFREEAFVMAAVGQGWADAATLEAMIDAWQRWGERPDAFTASLDGATVGWVGEDVTTL